MGCGNWRLRPIHIRLFLIYIVAVSHLIDWFTMGFCRYLKSQKKQLLHNFSGWRSLGSSWEISPDACTPHSVGSACAFRYTNFGSTSRGRSTRWYVVKVLIRTSTVASEGPLILIFEMDQIVYLVQGDIWWTLFVVIYFWIPWSLLVSGMSPKMIPYTSGKRRN